MAGNDKVMELFRDGEIGKSVDELGKKKYVVLDSATRQFCIGDHVSFCRANGDVITGKLTAGRIAQGKVLYQITDNEGIDHGEMMADRLELVKAWDA